MNNNFSEEDYHKFGPRKAKILSFKRPKGFMSYYYDHMLGVKHPSFEINPESDKDQIKRKQNDIVLIDDDIKGCKVEFKHKIEKKKNSFKLKEPAKRKNTIN